MGETILFGGWNSSHTFFSDTWSYAGGIWNHTGATGPGARRYAAMAYYPPDSELVLFGGECAAMAHCGDTWVLQGPSLSWKAITGSAGTAPSGRSGAAMTWDSTNRELLLVGGWSNTTFACPDTFTFSGSDKVQGTWTNISSTAGLLSPGRQRAQLADDPSAGDGGAILFGGEGVATDESDTWLFKNGTWRLQTLSTHPNGRYGAGFVWDPLLGAALLTGGTSTWGTYNTTWTWASGTWTDLTNSSGIPFSARNAFGYSFDTRDNCVLLFGGSSLPSPSLQDTWIYTNHAWSPVKEATLSITGPPARIYSSMAFDAKDGWIFLFGGENTSGLLNDLWSWSPSLGWREVCSTCSPPVRESSGLVWANDTSSATDPLYLFGGSTTGGAYLNDLWSFTITSATSGTWTSISPGGSTPTARHSFGMDWDPAQGLVIVVDGLAASAQNDVHAYSPLHNAWYVFTPTGSGPGVGLYGIQFAWDGTTSLFFGGTNGSSSYDGLYTLTLSTPSSGAWTTVSASASTTARAGGIFVYDSHFADMVMYGSSQVDPYPQATWDYNLTSASWEDRTNSSGTPPDSVAGATGVFDSASAYTVMTGTGGSSYPDWTWIYGPPLNQSLNLPTSLDSGHPLSASMSASGGSGNNAYSWHGLPSPCTSSNSTVSCTPAPVSTNTTYPIRTDVLDFVGDVASETHYLTIHPDPTVTSPVIVPGYTVESGTSITISATPAGGDGSYTFSWSGLPSGCLSVNAPKLTCTVTATSNSTSSAIQVTLSDGLGTTVPSGVASLFTVLAPFTVSTVSETPAGGVVDSGQAASFAVTASGGDGGYSFTWTGLPTGCVTSNARQISCNPTVTGSNQSFTTIQAHVTDALPSTILSTVASFTVNVAPAVTSLTPRALRKYFSLSCD